MELRDNSLETGTLVVINDNFRVALIGDIVYEPIQMHGRGGFIYQPLEWYYVGLDVYPRLRKLKIVNSFLNQRFGIDNMSMGLEMDAGSEDFNWDVFLQGVFAFKYLQLGVNSHWGVGSDPEIMVERSSFYGFNIICSLNFGF